MRFGIRAEWVDMEKIEGGGGGDGEGGEEVKGEGGRKGVIDSAERVKVRIQGKADGSWERGETECVLGVIWFNLSGRYLGSVLFFR